MPTQIKGQPTGAEVIARLKDEGRPVLLAFSCGKDSLGAWCALRDAGVEVVPVYLWYLPQLAFVEEELRCYERAFGSRIHRYPHPSFFRLIANGVDQPPARLRPIAELDIIVPSYVDTWSAIKDDLELPEDTWVADGVRAADSIVRRASFVKNGVMKRATRKVSPVADMLKAELMDLLDSHGIDLPIDYGIWGRSFDGIDFRFVEPMSRELPDDYAYLRRWFPLVDVELVRGEALSKSAINRVDAKAGESDYARRNRAEARRRAVATDGNSVMCVCFGDRRGHDKWRGLVGDGKIVSGDIVEAAFAPSCDGRRAQRPAEPRFGRLARSPLMALTQTGDLEADSLAEADCMLSHIESASPGGRTFTDTDDYVCVWFRSHDELDNFLRTRRLMRFGRLYVDGCAWMRSVR